MHQDIMRTNLILINFEFMVCVDQMNTEYQQDKFFWRLVDVMLWIGGFCPYDKIKISQLSYQVAGKLVSFVEVGSNNDAYIIDIRYY